MSMDRSREPWAGSTYNGFSGSSAPPPEPPRPPGASRRLLIGGLAGALALGLVFGLWARPNFGEDGKAREPMRPVQQTLLPVEVSAPVVTPVPESPGRLEVLPADLARAAPTPIAAAPRAMAPPPRPAPRVMAIAPPPVVAAPQPRDASARIAEPSFDCRLALSYAEEMVCEDAQLAAADRRLDRAFDRAVAAGFPARELRAEQDDWLEIREDAARRSPRAVASVYEQRIRELDALAEDYDY